MPHTHPSPARGAAAAAAPDEELEPFHVPLIAEMRKLGVPEDQIVCWYEDLRRERVVTRSMLNGYARLCKRFAELFPHEVVAKVGATLGWQPFDERMLGKRVASGAIDHHFPVSYDVKGKPRTCEHMWGAPAPLKIVRLGKGKSKAVAVAHPPGAGLETWGGLKGKSLNGTGRQVQFLHNKLQSVVPCFETDFFSGAKGPRDGGFDASNPKHVMWAREWLWWQIETFGTTLHCPMKTPFTNGVIPAISSMQVRAGIIEMRAPRMSSLPPLPHPQAASGELHNIMVPWGRSKESEVRANIFTCVRIGGEECVIVALASDHSSCLRMPHLAGPIIRAFTAFTSLMGTPITRAKIQAIYDGKTTMGYTIEEQHECWGLWYDELQSKAERALADTKLAGGMGMLDVMAFVYRSRGGEQVGTTGTCCHYQ